MCAKRIVVFVYTRHCYYIIAFTIYRDIIVYVSFRFQLDRAYIYLYIVSFWYYNSKRGSNLMHTTPLYSYPNLILKKSQRFEYPTSQN